MVFVTQVFVLVPVRSENVSESGFGRDDGYGTSSAVDRVEEVLQDRGSQFAKFVAADRFIGKIKDLARGGVIGNGIIAPYPSQPFFRKGAESNRRGIAGRGSARDGVDYFFFEYVRADN